jgi:Zn-finger nucleic acid-binding protein
MNCPVCQSEVLVESNLEENLPSFACANCGGNWIRGREYWRWLEKHGHNLPEINEPAQDQLRAEDAAMKPCPECAFTMFKYKVGHGLEFHLDQCMGCKGIWFDQNEWELLRARNLHDDIHALFTAPWQAEATREERKRRLEHMYIRKFGAEDYAEIKRVRAWLGEHKYKHELLAYLTDPDPLNT